MQNQIVEQETKTTEQDTKINSTEQETETNSAEQETKPNSTEQEAKANSIEQEAKTNSTKQEAKSKSDEQETKSNSTEKEFKSNLAEQKTESNSTEQESKNNSNSTEQDLTEENSLNNLTPSSSSYLLTSHLLNLTQELFIEICEKLEPKDLFTLTLVCKQFRTILWSNSPTTQQLWYKSRLKFVPKFSDLKPPGDLSEQKFVWLLIGETCQCCGKNITIESERRLFWEFKVLICSNCAQERTISLKRIEELQISENLEEILSCLPCISETILRNEFNFLVNATTPGYHGKNPYYWKVDVFRAIDEYSSLSETERENWLNKKQIELRNYLDVIEDMRAKENNSSLENLLRQILHK